MSNLLTRIQNKITDYYYLLLLICMTIMAYLGHIKLIEGFIFSYIICAILTLFIHEYAQHNVIVFKNLIFKKLFFSLAYLYAPTVPYKDDKGYIIWHIAHHNLWFTNTDYIEEAIKDSRFMFFCNTFAASTKNLHPSMISNIDASKYKSTWYYENWLVDYRRLILTICSVMFILLFGLVNYLSFYVLPALTVVMIHGAIADLYFHASNRQSKDIHWMLPIWFNITYHISHHKNPNLLYFGSKWGKYINLQYWIFLLAFTTNKTTSN